MERYGTEMLMGRRRSKSYPGPERSSAVDDTGRRDVPTHCYATRIQLVYLDRKMMDLALRELYYISSRLALHHPQPHPLLQYGRGSEESFPELSLDFKAGRQRPPQRYQWQAIISGRQTRDPFCLYLGCEYAVSNWREW